MIFVTVGTHEQPFNRLIEEVDRLKGEGVITEDVIIQRGYSTYKPKFCKYYDLISWDEMQKYNREARVIITHGGPASFIDVLSLGKTPIIVPRQSKFNEHVNDHQLEFAKKLVEKGEKIIVVENIHELGDVIKNYGVFNSEFCSNNFNFNYALKNEIMKLYK